MHIFFKEYLSLLNYGKHMRSHTNLKNEASLLISLDSIRRLQWQEANMVLRGGIRIPMKTLSVFPAFTMVL